MIDAIKGALRVLFTPSCWIQLHPYSAAWDRRLIQLMKDHKFVPQSAFRAKIGHVQIWVGNHPYASFHPYDMKVPEFRPRRITMLRAMDKFTEDTAELP